MSNVKKHEITLVIVVEVVATFSACFSVPLQRHYLLLPYSKYIT